MLLLLEVISHFSTSNFCPFVRQLHANQFYDFDMRTKMGHMHLAKMSESKRVTDNIYGACERHSTCTKPPRSELGVVAAFHSPVLSEITTPIHNMPTTILSRDYFSVLR